MEKKSAVREKAKVAQLTHAIHDEREGRAKVFVQEDGNEEAAFWEALGGKGPVADNVPEPIAKDKHAGKKSLHHLSDASGKFVFREIAAGKLPRKALDTNDVFILDTGDEVFAWVGLKASVGERSKALSFAHDYVVQNGKDPNIPIIKVLEGAENELFELAFD